MGVWTSRPTRSTPCCAGRGGRRRSVRARVLRQRGPARGQRRRAVVGAGRARVRRRQHPCRVRRWGAGPRRARHRRGGVRGRRMPAADAAGLARHLRVRSSPATGRTSRRTAGCRAWRPAATRWRSPSPSPTPAPTATASRPPPPRRRRLAPARDQVLHLRRRRRRPHARRRPHRRRRARPGAGELSLFVVDTDAPGPQPRADPGRAGRAREAVHPLLRRRRGRRRTGSSGASGGGLRPLFDGLNPERILSAALLNGIGRYALGKARGLRPRPPGVGHADRRAPGHRPPAGRGGQSTSSWPG